MQNIYVSNECRRKVIKYGLEKDNNIYTIILNNEEKWTSARTVDRTDGWYTCWTEKIRILALLRCHGSSTKSSDVKFGGLLQVLNFQMRPTEGEQVDVIWKRTHYRTRVPRSTT
jgi:hypothetical protein